MQPPAGPASRARPVALLALCLTLCALLVAACTIGPSRRAPLATSGTRPPADGAPSSSSSMPLGPGGPGRTADPIQWSRCPADVDDTGPDDSTFEVDCAGVPVPVSYADPNQGSFALRVARARTPGTPADAPPLVVLLGDPGQYGRSRVAAVASLLPTEIREHFAVITVDLRGTGFSSGIDCLSDATTRAIVGMAADPTSPAGSSQLEAIARQLTFDCGDLVGPSLSAFNSTNAADDLDTLRAALGDSGIRLLARGYGATIGAVYADRYPGRVAAMVLDSPTDPLATPDQQARSSAKAAESLLKDFAAACPGFDGGCPLGDDPAGTVTALVRNLASSGDGAGRWTITGGSVLMALLQLLPDQSSWPALAGALADLGEHNARPLADLLTAALGGSDLPERLAGRLVYRCNDTAQRLGSKQIAAAVAGARSEAPLFGPFTLALAGLCAAWPAPEAALGRVTASGARPLLVVGSVKNPLHPYTGVQSVAGQLASAVLVSWQSGTDGAYPNSACVTGTVDGYLLHDTVPAMGILCPP
jgi:pimeloyl-ACP methyl ester carboxylesterase